MWKKSIGRLPLSMWNMLRLWFMRKLLQERITWSLIQD